MDISCRVPSPVGEVGASVVHERSEEAPDIPLRSIITTPEFQQTNAQDFTPYSYEYSLTNPIGHGTYLQAILSLPLIVTLPPARIIMSLDFSDEIEKFEAALAEKRTELAELEQKRDTHTDQTRKARAALEDLRAVLRGETPPSKKASKPRSVRGISAIEVDDETGRPPRGARRRQILDICRKIGSDGDIFRTADVLTVLRKVEGDEDGTISPGMRSYTYTVMNTLGEEGHIKRKGRGKWIWKG